MQFNIDQDNLTREFAVTCDTELADAPIVCATFATRREAEAYVSARRRNESHDAGMAAAVKVRAQQKQSREAQRARREAMRSLGMKRTSSGTWE